MTDLKTILQTSSPGRPVNPNLRYGGTDKVIFYLDKEFTKKGYNSLVAGTGDSRIKGKLIETIPSSYNLWNMNGEVTSEKNSKEKYENCSRSHYKRIFEIISKYKEIDIIHDHEGNSILNNCESLRFLNETKAPLLITLHSNMSEKYKQKINMWKEMISDRRDVYFNAISESQKEEFEKSGLEIKSTIHHGIPLEEFTLQKNKSNYLFSLGRICPKKGQDVAIKVAKKARNPLIIGGVVNSIHHNYWKEEIEPNLNFSISDIPEIKQEAYKEKMIEDLKNGKEIIDSGEIAFIGDLNDRQKSILYGKAKGFLMPINWTEPFGLTMIESMACGTPVISYSIGAVPEIVKEKETGYVIKKAENKNKNISSMADATNEIKDINPKKCREHIEKNFSLGKESNNYLELYKKIMEDQ